MRFRASCLASLGVFFLAIATGCHPFQAQAVKANYQFELGYPIEHVMVPGMNRLQTGAQQREELWCWAACAAMVRKYHAMSNLSSTTQPTLDQGQIVEKIHGRRADLRAAEETEVVAALDVDHYADVQLITRQASDAMSSTIITLLFDRKKRKEADALAKQRDAEAKAAGKSTTQTSLPSGPNLGFDPTLLIHCLQNHEPVVAALHGEDSGSGHVVVVIGAEFQMIPDRHKPEDEDAAETRLMCVQFFDPFKDDRNAKKKFGGIHTLAASEFARHCDFMASKSIAENYLQFLRDYNQAVKELAENVLPPTTQPAH